MKNVFAPAEMLTEFYVTDSNLSHLITTVEFNSPTILDFMETNRQGRGHENATDEEQMRAACVDSD